MSAPLKYYSCTSAIEYQDINALKTIASPIIILGVTGCDLDETDTRSCVKKFIKTQTLWTAAKESETEILPLKTLE